MLLCDAGKDAISISEQLIQLFRFFQVAMKSETGQSGDRKKNRGLLKCREKKNETFPNTEKRRDTQHS